MYYLTKYVYMIYIRSETRNFLIQIETSSMPTEKLDNFRKDLFNAVASLKFRKLNDSFQEKMKPDTLDIKSSPNVLKFADKTSNIYKQHHKNIISCKKIMQWNL